MKEMILLGAGASVEAGVPDSYSMSEKILGAFEERYTHAKHPKVISFVLGGLLFQNSIRGLNPLKNGVNVEDLFNAIELLRDRHTLEAAPFVGSWHSMIDEFDTIEPPQLNLRAMHRAIYKSVADEIMRAMPRHAPAFGDTEIDRNLQTMIRSIIHGSHNHSVSANISRAIGNYVVKITNEWMNKLKQPPHSNYEFERVFKEAMERESKPGKGKIFDEVAEYMIRTLANIVWIDDPQKIAYLQPLLNICETQKQLTIATLNYDNSIEVSSKNKGNCTTCIEEWSQTGLFESDDDGIMLLKLHGSIDWALSEGMPDENRPLPYTVIKHAAPDDVKKAGFKPAVVFGHRNKLTADGPFLDILRAFQRELEKADRLTVVGYSFGDEHINIYIGNWLNQSRERVIRVIDPNFAGNENDFALLLRRLEDRVQIIEKTAGFGIAQAFGK